MTATSSSAMIELSCLSKWFAGPRGRRVVAVEDLTFSVNAGEVFGLLGPNGAGKTTTLRMLCTVLKPSAGTAKVAGHDIVSRAHRVRQSIGFLSANTGVYDRMTACEMVGYYGKLHGLAGDRLAHRMDELFTALKMNEFRNRRCGQLSTGMKQKISIARALIHDPPVLIFDEPTAGLDVLVQRSVLQQIAELRSLGKCIIFSTHVIHEVSKLCDRVGIMARGGIVDIGTLPELEDRHAERDIEELFFKLVGATD